MRLYALACACSVYRFLRKYDIAYDKFLDKTKPYLDMHNSEHRKALLKSNVYQMQYWMRALIVIA